MPDSRTPAQAEDNLREKLRQLEYLLKASRDVAAMETLDGVLEALVQAAVNETDAERGSLFLHDEETHELYSRIAQGNYHREIRLMENSGIIGHAFTKGEAAIIHDAYADKRFNRSIDRETGFITKSVLAAPIRTARGDVIGVIQVLNKRKGKFTKKDMDFLEALTTQAAITLRSTQLVERMERSRVQEMEFLNVVADVTSELDLTALLQKVMSEATRMLNADRSTLFLNDEKTNELWSTVGQGLDKVQIRMPNHLGIAGAVFTSGKTINIPYAYADLRFNPAFDKKTGYFTRSILCVPVVNKEGKRIGVTQVLNKRGGPFTEEDERRLRAFTAQISIGLENAKLFDDVQNMKNYNESMLESMSNGVITLDESGKIVTCNQAGLRIMHTSAEEVLGKPCSEYFSGDNAWIMDKLKRVEETQKADIFMDAEMTFSGNKTSLNLTILPLINTEQKKLGTMIVMEDISNEKRVKATMSRYMDPGLADQLLEGGEEILGGKSLPATVLFSDVRSFTSISEELGPQRTVAMLNEYFTIMVDCIQREGGMLDKFIGDAIMAGFGIPLSKGDDEDRAVRATIAMISELGEWNKKRIKSGEKPIDMGIGLNSGEVVSGNIGSPKRMDYTMIGDGVNLAARLESACKQYGARILISENTYKKLKGTYRMREVDRVVVKGKTQPVVVYEVLDYHSDETFPNVMEALNTFKHGLELYRTGNWDKAITAFGEVLKINPKDKPSTMYIERCEHLKADPPSKWDGVWVMTSK